MINAALLQNRSRDALQTWQSADHSVQEKSKAQEKLHESEAKYHALVQQLPVITYIASLESPGKLLFVSPQISQLGYPLQDWLDEPIGLFTRVHKDDLSHTVEAFSHTYEHYAALRCEYRLVKKDGTFRWFLDEANVVRDETGKNLFLQGVLVDITKDKEIEQELSYYRQRLEELVVLRTEQLEKQCVILKTANNSLDKALIELKQTNHELRQSELRFRLLTEAADEGIIGVNERGCCTFANRPALAMLGYANEEILGQDIQTVLGRLIPGKPNQQAEESSLQKILSECVKPRVHEIFNRRDGSSFLVEYASYPIEVDGLIDSSVLVFRDITESQAQIQNLAHQASHDPLTGLVNRTEFELRLSRVLASMQVGDTQHALCFLDLDHFKNINDSYGHAAGDHLLRTFSTFLATKLRQRDTLARLGGDEFALLLEHTTLDQAYRIAHEICESVHSQHFIWADNEFSISVSIGIAVLLHAEADTTEAMGNADIACYEAKKNGRNQIHVFSS